MSGTFEKYFMAQFWKQDEPEANAPIKYHPEFGFEGRLEDRQVKPKTSATLEEMDSAGLENILRNECAYWHIRYRGCIIHNQPFFFKCKGIRKEIEQCYIRERIDDMKEFERERRLNIRERKLAEMEAKS